MTEESCNDTVKASLPYSAFADGLQKFSHTSIVNDKEPAKDVSLISPSQERRKPQQEPASSPPRKRRRTEKHPASYADPAKYADLPMLNDVLAPNLLVLFIGLNPGITTAQSGHAYAHPSNLFWKLLHSSGLTDRRCAPQEDVNLPELYSCGFTNIVSRPSKDQSELSKAEMVAGTPALESKAREWQPEACCLVGKGIWEAVWKYRHGRALKKAEFNYGWQDEASNMGRSKKWTGARVFVAASTSGASASLKPAEKEAIWRPLGEWAQQRRIERALKAEDAAGGEFSRGESVGGP